MSNINIYYMISPQYFTLIYLKMLPVKLLYLLAEFTAYCEVFIYILYIYKELQDTYHGIKKIYL